MTEQFNDEISGGPQRRGHRAVAWATLAALGAVAFGGGAYALTRGATGGSAPSTSAAAQLAAATSASPNASASPKSDDGRPGPGGRFGPMMRGPAGPMGGMLGIGPGVGGQLLHAEATVQTPDGKTEVVDTQRGTISSLDVGKQTLTVTSSDQVSFSYVTDANTRFVVLSAAKPAQATLTDLKQGDTVVIVAIRSGDTRTAKSVVDGIPTVKDHMRGLDPDRRPGAPTPSTSAAGTSA